MIPTPPPAVTEWCPVLLAGRKAEARQAALRRRAALDPAGAAEALAAHVLRDAPLPPPGATIAGFWSMGTEIAHWQSAHALAERSLQMLQQSRAVRGARALRRLLGLAR